MPSAQLLDLRQTVQPIPRLRYLPEVTRAKNSVQLQLVEGVLIFRAAPSVQKRIEVLLKKQRLTNLNSTEEIELQAYEEMDDYLSFLNRMTRNMLTQSGEGISDVPDSSKAI